MAVRYKCPNPNCLREYDTLPGNDYLCKNLECARKGKKLVAIEERPVPEERSVLFAPEKAADARSAEVEGFCVLICDASNSMDESAFRSEPAGRTRLRLVVDAVQGALEEMVMTSKIDTAYIAIIAYGVQAKLLTDRAGEPFFKSIKDIVYEFGGPESKKEVVKERYNKATLRRAFKKEGTLGDYLNDQLSQDRLGIDRGGTNITAALRLGRELIDAVLKKDLSPFGIDKRVSLVPQSPFETPDGDTVDVPNVRAMIYSDGEHNQKEPIENAFADMQPVSVLMTAFIGDDQDEKGNFRPGAEVMKQLATICPAHRNEGYFLINNAERGEFLRDIFHMATGTSGLCMECKAGT